MPGYEPFLLCDFHVHTQWSDGRLPLSEVVDLYGQTRKFDVIAITDHILMKRDLLARMGRVASLGRRRFGVDEKTFDAYLDDIRREAARAMRQYGLLVIPGAEITQNRLRGRLNSHIIGLNLDSYISADQTADQILIAGLVRLLQVVQQLAPLIDHLEQTAPGVVVVLVTSEVVGELVDPRREQCHLHFRRPCIGRIPPVLGDDLGFLCRFESHFDDPL